MIRCLAILPLFAPMLSSQTTPTNSKLLTDFDRGGVSLRWNSVNDGVMGGRSRGSFRIVDGRLRFQGSLNTNGGGFASLRTRPRDLALADFDGVYLRVRGDGRVYTMRLQQRGGDGRRSVSYRAEFRTQKRSPDAPWQDVWLTFDAFVPTWRGRVLDLPPVDPARVEGLGLMIADKIDGEFRLEVDSIHAYSAFALAGARNRSRPLLVFAPNADDPRLAEQLAAVRAESAACADRDMETIVVLEDGGAMAGERPLSAATAKQLGREFGVGDGDFVVALVGKDGETKRTAAEPIPLVEIFAQIDAMPMRRAELARRRDQQ